MANGKQNAILRQIADDELDHAGKVLQRRVLAAPPAVPMEAGEFSSMSQTSDSGWIGASTGMTNMPVSCNG
jgi:hypothetical protein